MSNYRRKGPREKDLTSRYFTGDFDEDRIGQEQQFTSRNKNAQQNKIEQTALLRAAEGSAAADIETLPLGQVVQMFSLFCEVEHPTGTRLCVVRKTLSKLSNTGIVVGDFVRFRDVGIADEHGKPEAIIEQTLPRRTILTRANSFSGKDQHPIVANADQMLIVASLVSPKVKWGLIDRMLVAAQSGKLAPIVCLNKVDLAQTDDAARAELAFADEALAHYATIGVRSIRASAPRGDGLDELREILRNKTTVLSGHSGVGKSSLITAVQPALDIRVGEVSHYTDKGRHTTTSARRYLLDIGGQVIDTPGVKMFGLWGVTAENLEEFFPDVAAGSAPVWRKESFTRILRSIA